VSGVLVNNTDGTVDYYAKLLDSSSSASGSLSIPLAVVADGTYTLKVFSEQLNGDNLSDYASTPIAIPLEIKDGIGTVSNLPGSGSGTTPPILSEGNDSYTTVANRTGDPISPVLPHTGDATINPVLLFAITAVSFVVLLRLIAVAIKRRRPER
jgi:hypothetical protein